jgi:hypothetical protein
MPITLLNVSGGLTETVLGGGGGGTKPSHASINSHHGTGAGQAALNNTIKVSQVNRRSAVTKCSIDEENESGDDESFLLTNLDLIMNSNDLLDGEYGLGYIKCCRCDLRLEYYNEDSLGGLIVICSTILHRELSLVAPFVLDMITAIMRFELSLSVF